MHDIFSDFFDVLHLFSLHRMGASQLGAPPPGGHNVFLSVLRVLSVAGG